MTQQEQIVHIAGFADISKAAAGRLLKEIVKMIAVEVMTTGRFNLVDLGVFRLKQRAGGLRSNPRQPGVRVAVSPYKTVVFRPSKHLKAAVKE